MKRLAVAAAMVLGLAIPPSAIAAPPLAPTRSLTPTHCVAADKVVPVPAGLVTAGTVYVSDSLQAAPSGSTVVANTSPLGKPSTIVATAQSGAVMWTKDSAFPTVGYKANDSALMYSVLGGAHNGFYLEFDDPKTGSVIRRDFIHSGADSSWPGAFSGGFLFGQVYPYGPGRTADSPQNTVDIDIYNNTGQLRRGIALRDPYYDGTVALSSTGSTLWIGVPIMSPAGTGAAEEAIWRVTASSIRRYTIPLLSGDGLLVGINAHDIMVYGPPSTSPEGVQPPPTVAWRFTNRAEKLWTSDLDIAALASGGPDNTVYTDGGLVGGYIISSLAVNGLTGVVRPLGIGGMEFFPWYIGKAGAIGFYGQAGASTGKVIMMTAYGRIRRAFMQHVSATQQALVLSSSAGVEILSPWALGSRAIRVPTGC